LNPTVGANITECSIVNPGILEKLKLSIWNWLSFFKYTPFDAFSARRSRQRSTVAPEISEVKAVEKRLNIGVLSLKLLNWWSSIVNRNYLIKEVVILITSCNSVEGNSDYSTQCTTSIQMDKVKLQVSESTIESVFRWSV
jgi:hypothetical protein